MLFVAVGAVAATGASTAIVKAFVVIALVVAVLLGLMAWGVLHSLKLDLAEQRLDSAIEQAVVARGGSMCDCGVAHDPDELHIVGDDHRHGVDDPCASDGHGVGCTHSCDTCVLGAMRPSPRRTRAERLA